mmetsp:Transcript_3729/g.4659  ORF Transcript_3729/g.4659 Transcript_3729/m.4659 type:complete len:93 (+) Transcript_3729:109-387(+)
MLGYKLRAPGGSTQNLNNDIYAKGKSLVTIQKQQVPYEPILEISYNLRNIFSSILHNITHHTTGIREVVSSSILHHIFLFFIILAVRESMHK